METHKPLLAGEAIRFGWKTLKENTGFLLGVIGLYIGVQIVFAIIQTMLDTGADTRSADMISMGAAWWIVYIVSLVVSLLMGIGLLKISLAFVDGKKPEFSELFSQTKYLARFLGVYIAYGLIVFVGFLLLIIPGIYWALKYQFAMYLVVDKDMGIGEALKASGEMTDGRKWDLIGINLVIAMFTYLGLLGLLVGLLATVPAGMIAMAFVYRKLQQS